MRKIAIYRKMETKSAFLEKVGVYAYQFLKWWCEIERLQKSLEQPSGNSNTIYNSSYIKYCNSPLLPPDDKGRNVLLKKRQVTRIALGLHKSAWLMFW